MNGKIKCELLKSIRCKIAKENGLSYALSECTFQGECKGTCPKCEAELKKLSEDLHKLRQAGKRVAVAGIATAMIAASVAGCTPDQSEDDEWELIDSDYTGFTVEEETDGKYIDEDFDGDYYIPEELTGDIGLEEE